MRTLRTNGEDGEKMSFMGMSFVEFLLGHGRACPGHPRLSCRCTVKTWMPGTRPGMTSYRETVGLRRDDFLPLLAKTLDTERDHVADIEEGRRLHAGADAGWRARGDDIARQQREELRDVGDAFGHGEDHGRGRAGLAALAVDVEPHRQLLHVRYFILGDQPGTYGAKGVVRLSLGPLPQTLDLEIALGHVIADAIAGDVVERIVLGDILGASADDGGNFDLPVEFCGAARF